MSHFIIWSISTSYLGTPNGHDSTQFEQPMQRGFSETLHHAVGRLLDGVRRAHPRANRIFAVHADLRRGLHALAALDGFQMNHRNAAVRVALRAGLHAGLASDAARVVDVECTLAQRIPPASVSSCAIASVGSSVLETRTAQILNSGIFDTGSMARIVRFWPSGRAASDKE